MGRDATPQDLAELKYLEMCILETMRLFPPAPMMTRNLVSDLKLYDGEIIPRGVDVVVFPYELHTDPKEFENPFEFRPDRFSPENTKQRHNYAYLPFSKGPRSCLGQKYAMLQSKTILARILKRFSFRTETGMENVGKIMGTVLEIDCDLIFKISPRRKIVEEINNN